MEILSNVMSKDILESNETNVATGAQVCHIPLPTDLEGLSFNIDSEYCPMHV